MFSGAKIFFFSIFQIDIMQLFRANSTTFSKKKKSYFFSPENMKKPPLKVPHNHPKLFFSVLPIGPKPAQITFFVP